MCIRDSDMTLPLSNVAGLRSARFIVPARFWEMVAWYLATNALRGRSTQQAVQVPAGFPANHYATHELKRHTVAGPPPRARRTPTLEQPPPRQSRSSRK